MLRKLSIVFCLLAMGFLGFSQNKKKQKNTAPQTISTESKIDYKEIGAPLPPLKIYTREGKHLTENDLKNDANLILMLFNPTCEHCEDQTIDFKNNIFLFKKSHIVLLAAPGMGSYLTYFMNNTKIQDYPTLQVGLDSSGYIEKTYKYVTLPQINIYNKERKLIKMFYGTTPIDSLKAYIE